MTSSDVVEVKNDMSANQRHDDGNMHAYGDAPMDTSFSNLELFVSAFPGPDDLKDEDAINGFTELSETFIRSLQFFWPRDNIRITAVLDDTTYSNDQERDGLVARFKSLFSVDVVSSVRVEFNNRTNRELFGTGWYIQQLIMLWADNFTDAEYIGFVDDDTIITSAVHPYDLFDEQGRPRVIAQSSRDEVPKSWMEASQAAFKRNPRLQSMTYFPVIIKREHLRLMRADIMSKHPEYSCFDDFFTALIHRQNSTENLSPLSQFCLMMEYAYEAHREEYDWHFETGHQVEFSTEQMYEPFPRIAIHASFMFIMTKRIVASKKVSGRRQVVTDILKEGYCFSLLSYNETDLNVRRCQQYYNGDQLYGRGQWRFEQKGSYWRRQNATATAEAVTKRKERMTDHFWDEDEVKTIFGF